MHYIPATRERVQLRGAPWTYLVIAVDADAKTANVVRVDQVLPQLEEVSFSDIRPIVRQMPSDAA